MAAGLVALAMLIARGVQARQLTRLFTEYEQMPVHVLSWTTALRAGGTVLAVPASPGTPAGYTAIEFDRDRCGMALFRATVRYRSARPVDDFSFDVWVNLLAASRERVYFPAVSAPSLGTLFEGLELPAEAAPCIARWSIGEPPPGRPLLIAELPADWRALPLRQRRGDSGGGIRQADGFIYLNRPDRAVSAAITTVPNGPLEKLEGKAPNAYLLRSAPAQVSDAHTFVIEGEARRGGFVAGLQLREQWTETIAVPRAGRFLVLLRPASSGEYRVVVADGGKGGDHGIALTRAGWLPPRP